MIIELFAKLKQTDTPNKVAFLLLKKASSFKEETYLPNSEIKQMNTKIRREVEFWNKTS